MNRSARRQCQTGDCLGQIATRGRGQLRSRGRQRYVDQVRGGSPEGDRKAEHFGKTVHAWDARAANIADAAELNDAGADLVFSEVRDFRAWAVDV